MLLLQQVQQVAGRTNAQQSFDRVNNESDSALRRHGEGSPDTGKRLNVARRPTALNKISAVTIQADLVQHPLVVAPLGLHLDVEIEVHASAEIALELVPGGG